MLRRANGATPRRGLPVVTGLALIAVLTGGCFHAGPGIGPRRTAPDAQALASNVTGGTDDPRAAAVETAFDVHNPEVGPRVAHFQTRLRGFFDRAMERGARYVPTMSEMLVREGLPAELAYLPLIESGYRPHAVSRAGAAGPWQFIPETGRRYGLRIDALVDERRDPIMSTQAAVRYLKDLYDMFGDWELSLAAYNSGEYRVARILARTDATGFWDMRARGYLPDETSEYVPRFLAAVRIARAPEAYGFEPPLQVPYHFETVQVERQVPLRTVASLSGVSTAELAELNPALRRGITPSGYALKVPTGVAAPLRAALANYVEPARPRRSVARNHRASPHKTSVAKTRTPPRQLVRRPPRSARLAKAPARTNRNLTTSRRPSPPARRLTGNPARGTRTLQSRPTTPPKRPAAAQRGAATRPSAARGSRGIQRAR